MGSAALLDPLRIAERDPRPPVTRGTADPGEARVSRGSGRARAPIIFSIDFPLKPYLHDFLSGLAGGHPFILTNSSRLHLVGQYARLGMGRRIVHQQHHQKFRQGRSIFTVLVSERAAESYGMHPRHYVRFESLVEKLFYHMLLAHIEAAHPEPRELRACVRRFMDRYEVGGDCETVTRVVLRMQKRQDN